MNLVSSTTDLHITLCKHANVCVGVNKTTLTIGEREVQHQSDATSSSALDFF